VSSTEHLLDAALGNADRGRPELDRRPNEQADPETKARYAGVQIAQRDLWTPTPAPWPILDPTALYGLPGEVVEALAPETEADPAGLLLSFFVFFGCIVDRGPHVIIGGDQHPARLFGVLVGESGKARKGSSFAMVRAVMAEADPVFVRDRILGGFGSGEALVDAASEDDRRVLVRDPEFARLLTIATRDGSTLSMYVRDAWDGHRLEDRSRKGGKVVVDGAHVSIATEITAEELRAKLTAVETANGFANRFLFVCVRDSQRLPKGGSLDEATIAELGKKVQERLDYARVNKVMHRTPEADELWVPLYHAMCEDKAGGLLGAVIARDRTQMVRLQVAYALTDGSRYIERHHVEAAWALWRYCRASAAHIFAGSLGDPIADRLLAALRKAGPAGLDGTQQSALFDRHVTAAEWNGRERYWRSGSLPKPGGSRPAGAPELLPGSAN